MQEPTLAGALVLWHQTLYSERAQNNTQNCYRLNFISFYMISLYFCCYVKLYIELGMRQPKQIFLRRALSGDLKLTHI